MAPKQALGAKGDAGGHNSRNKVEGAIETRPQHCSRAITGHSGIDQPARVKQPGNGSRPLWNLAGRQLLLLLLDQLADGGIGALVTGLSSLSISTLTFIISPGESMAGSHVGLREEAYDVQQFSSH